MKFVCFSAFCISVFSLAPGQSYLGSSSIEAGISSFDEARVRVGGNDRQDDPRADQVIEVINQFFTGLKIKNQATQQYRQHITDDFFIFEMGKKYSMDELMELFQTGDREWISTDWKLSDFRVSLDENSAHASYVNTGVFYFKQDGKKFRSDLKWLESVYLVRQGDRWRIRFLQSDDVSRETKEVAAD